MKKQSGFTLIELVVAMAVLGLIMGAMVHLFGSSVTSLHVGPGRKSFMKRRVC